MADPVTWAYIASASSAAFSGVSGYMAAQGEKQQAEINSYIGKTRAIQTDVQARSGMESELGSIRSTLAANQQRPGVGTFEVLNQLRSVRSRDRRVEFGNRMQESADWRLAGKNASQRGTMSLLGGVIKAAPSMFDLYDYHSKG